MLCHTTLDFPGKTFSFSSGAFKPTSDRLGIVHPGAQAQHKDRCQTKEPCVVSPCVVKQRSVWNIQHRLKTGTFQQPGRCQVLELT